MKHISRAITAIFMAILMATLLPVQVFADTPDYISEIKIAMGDNAETDLKDYTILKVGNNAVDLNQKAGGGTGSKGEKRVLLGYKTTRERSEAITDLALMNMKGGYSVAEYEVLMETQMKTQIIPFVEDFLTAINEYRENYVSKNKENNQRAHYIHDILNKLTDDDTGKPLGDLLLNETKFEMGDEKYDALPDEEKKNHADILTIIAQSNGKATLLLKNLLTRACDTEDDTWIERFVNLTYEDLIKQTGLPPKEARKKVAKEFDDDANLVLSMWDTFREQLLHAKERADDLKDTDTISDEEIKEKYEKIDDDSTVEEYVEAFEALLDEEEQAVEVSNAASDIAVATYLKAIEYGEGTLYDFFTQTYDAVADDITMIYPLVAALSDGQRSGLEFISLRELVIISDQSKAYDDEELDKLPEASVYEGVDRGIYQKGGVALTSEALRSDALLNDNNTDTSSFSTLTYVFITLSVGSAVGFCLTLATKGFVSLANRDLRKSYEVATAAASKQAESLNTGMNFHKNMLKLYQNNSLYTADEVKNVKNAYKAAKTAYSNREVVNEAAYEPFAINNTAVKGFAIGFAVAAVILSAVSVYLAYQDMKESYKVEFTPIPHYMIDEKDLVGYNSKGEKVVLKNQSAYYKAVECNRTESDEMWKSIGACADMNGDVGSQWLALYAAKNENEKPIIADSLTVVVNSDKVPAEYETGIHMFGSSSAFNLNNKLYDWNQEAPSVFVYYQVDESVPNTTGTNFTAGSLALTGGSGIVLGAVVTALVMKAKRKKDDNKAVTA